MEEESRKDIDYIIRDIEAMFPHSNTVFEHIEQHGKYAQLEEQAENIVKELNTEREEAIVAKDAKIM